MSLSFEKEEENSLCLRKTNYDDPNQQGNCFADIVTKMHQR